MILEDTSEPDGTKGLLIDMDAPNDYEEGSLAHEYAAAFVQHIVGQANKATILDKDDPMGTKKNLRSEEDPNLS